MELKQLGQEEQQLQWKSNSQPESMVTVTLGRVMSTLLAARSKKLHDSISRLSPDDKTTSLGSMDESLWFLYKYVRDAAERDEILDEVLVPMIEHSLRSKESKHGGQTIILLDWFFKDELLFQAVATNLANIITRKDDRYITLGWCTLVRTLLEYETAMDQHLLNGIREKYDALLKMLCSCIPHLSYIVCKGSTINDGFELPSRLSVSAADCLLSLTEALTKTPRVSTERQKSSNFKASDQHTTLISSATREKKGKPVHKSLELTNMEMEFLLWGHLQELISLVQRLLAWSKKSRPLHAKGLEKVVKWLQDINGQYGGIQAEAGSKVLKTGPLLLFSCWKHYCVLLHLEDRNFSKNCRELLDQYLSGIQYYSDNHSEEHMESKDGGLETRKFFLNCICLLLGRFDGKKFESIMSEYGTQISSVLLSQLRCHDDDVIDGVVCIFKTALFKLNHSPGSSFNNTRQIDSVLPLLLHLLDERDGTARAVAMLIAEYCSISADAYCLQEVFKRLASGNAVQRRNALDVVSELISSHSTNAHSNLAWQDIATNLLECLGDEEALIREQTSNLLPMIDPSVVLPGLVHLLYSSDEIVQSSASDACIRLLKYHSQKFEVICMLLDCLSNLNQSQDLPETAGCTREGSKLDSDRLFRLIPQWSESVQDWNSLVGPLIDKMFAEPSNAIIVRFLSCISEHLMKAADVVLYRVLLQMRGQKGIEESFFKWDCGIDKSVDSVKMQQYLFEHLCPLLVIRLLPLRVFDDLNSTIMYGQLLNELITNEFRGINIVQHECVAAFLLNRAFSKFEFEDVRKLAAELCGRIHPEVLLPIACSQLEHAAGSKDILKMKACLFSVCTLIVVRGKDSISHPAMLGIRKTLEAVLLWPSSDKDEVYKAQHGCIDCLALMICAELQSPELCKELPSLKNNFVKRSGDPGNSVSGNSVLTYVICHIINEENKNISRSKLVCEKAAIDGQVSLSFRLCMVNVLISACQKISDSGKRPFAKKALPLLIRAAEDITEPEIRSACIQVLFSAVYQLKSAVLPYSSDLLKLSLKFLGKESEKERIAGAKLMASLMASEDAILESVSGGLLEARSLLSSISSTDPSLDLRRLCNKLLACLTSS
ncbi:putative ARM repeat superfamily protein [Melia azedarach]|uniref:ARM repeat superfamily protein n=1 Tax=Melia azedarach TaxID=155640 RepID=A0ACC1X5S2_MELAZ|nr:putative ARM repeat superfamily protein [Melia azedarach]